ncbi:peroxidase [Biscogniauxia mediterranea]|nr:peroxidase [Biscogniauxia mediterranea]
MKKSTILISLAATEALAYPGMDRALSEIQARDDYQLKDRSTDLLGDLVGNVVTPVGSTIKGILQGNSATVGGSTYSPTGPLSSSSCAQDPLCRWYWIVQDMQGKFSDQNGCTDDARGAIRQGFHDAATWDISSSYGGADGSLLLSDELSRPENLGLAPIGEVTKAWYETYKQYGVTMADIIQTAAIVATVSCPGGPRIRAFVGRHDDSRAGPEGKLPLPFQDAQYLINLFQAKTFTASDLVALVGAHTASKQFFVDPTRAGASQDSTPNVWDSRFYAETLSSTNQSSIFTFQSDKNLATFPSTSGQWAAFADPLHGQGQWGPAYAQAYFRMSMLGVNNLQNLTEITQVIPLPR